MLSIGLWMGYDKKFQGTSWLALTIIGAVFTLRDITVFDFELSKITTALVLISLGLYVVFKPKRLKNFDNQFQAHTADSEMKS